MKPHFWAVLIFFMSFNFFLFYVMWRAEREMKRMEKELKK